MSDAVVETVTEPVGEAEKIEAVAEPATLPDEVAADEATPEADPEPATVPDKGVLDPDRMGSIKTDNFGEDVPREVWDTSFGREMPDYSKGE